MHGSKTIILILLCGSLARAHEFSGVKALDDTRMAVANGPRPSGSDALRHLRTEIVATLRTAGCAVSFDDFKASTTNGVVAMRNIMCRFPGKSGKAIVITGHYDTKILPHFVGANDGGSSTGFLLELANALSGAPRIDDVILVFFDGEEAVKQWTETDSLYGSRHLAGSWEKNGTLRRVKALINIDMIGDRDLKLVDDANSDPALRSLVWKRAAALGYAAHFPDSPSGIEDDHMPFIHAGVRALDLIDFDYGPDNSYWHTPQDTLDKLSPQSFEIIGTVVLDAIRQLETMP